MSPPSPDNAANGPKWRVRFCPEPVLGVGEEEKREEEITIKIMITIKKAGEGCGQSQR